LKVVVAANITKAFAIASFASNFRGIANFQNPDESVWVNLIADLIGNIFSKVIDKLMEICGKIKILEKILHLALENRLPPFGSKSNTAYKKCGSLLRTPRIGIYPRDTLRQVLLDNWNVAVIIALMVSEKYL
jgi:hypothetical protein